MYYFFKNNDDSVYKNDIIKKAGSKIDLVIIIESNWTFNLFVIHCSCFINNFTIECLLYVVCKSKD